MLELQVVSIAIISNNSSLSDLASRLIMYEKKERKQLRQRMVHMAHLVRDGRAQFLDVSREIYHDEYFLRQPSSSIYLTNDDERASYKIRLIDGKFIKSCSGHYYDTSTEVAHESPSAIGRAIFVVSLKGEIYSGTKIRNVMQHGSFLAGGPVAFAGTWRIINGDLVEISNYSGHYRTSLKQISVFLNRLASLGVNIERVKIRRIFQVFGFYPTFTESSYAAFSESIKDLDEKTLQTQLLPPNDNEVVIHYGPPLSRLLSLYGFEVTEQNKIIELMFLINAFDTNYLSCLFEKLSMTVEEKREFDMIYEQAIQHQTNDFQPSIIFHGLFKFEEDNWPKKAHAWLINSMRHFCSPDLLNANPHQSDIMSLLSNLTCKDLVISHCTLESGMQQLTEWFYHNSARVAQKLGADTADIKYFYHTLVCDSQAAESKVMYQLR